KTTPAPRRVRGGPRARDNSRRGTSPMGGEAGGAAQRTYPQPQALLRVTPAAAPERVHAPRPPEGPGRAQAPAQPARPSFRVLYSAQSVSRAVMCSSSRALAEAPATTTSLPCSLTRLWQRNRNDRKTEPK